MTRRLVRFAFTGLVFAALYVGLFVLDPGPVGSLVFALVAWIVLALDATRGWSRLAERLTPLGRGLDLLGSTLMILAFLMYAEVDTGSTIAFGLLVGGFVCTLYADRQSAS